MPVHHNVVTETAPNYHVSAATLEGDGDPTTGMSLPASRPQDHTQAAPPEMHPEPDSDDGLPERGPDQVGGDTQPSEDPAHLPILEDDEDAADLDKFMPD